MSKKSTRPKKSTPNNSRRSGSVIFMLILVAAMIVTSTLMPVRLGLRWWLWTWLINLGLMFLLIGVVSRSIGAKSGFWAIFVDDRNRFSLSRFQVVLWTLVVLSAFWTLALARVSDAANPAKASTYISAQAPKGGEAQAGTQPASAAPADIQLPAVLWALMGISITSAVASPLIKEDKARRTAAGGGQALYQEALRETVKEALSVERLDAATFSNRGAIVVRNPGNKPRFSDMFRGEETANFPYLDIAKLQNFLFTVVAVTTYSVALGSAFAGATSIAALFRFPDVSEGLAVLLGISHGGYLVTKAAVTPGP